MVEWFRQLSDIPGVDTAGIPHPDVSRLAGFGAVPTVSTFEFDGKRRETLDWSFGDQYGSASPAKEIDLRDFTDLSSAQILERCYQGLWLPGEGSDYHFLLLHATRDLWPRRRKEPQVLESIERLCLLDLSLIEAYPTAITNEYGNDPAFYQVPAFSTLVNLYQREGALHEALDIARRAIRFDQLVDERDRIAERIAAVDQEVS